MSLKRRKVFFDDQLLTKDIVSSVRIVKYNGTVNVAGEVPGMSRGAPDPIPGCARLPDQRDFAAVFGAAHRDHRRTSRPDKWTGHGEVQRLLREVLLLRVCPLREEDMLRLQGGAHGHPAP